MKKLYVVSLLFLVFFSCHKNRIPFTSQSIESLSTDFNDELEYRTQLRLSFAKVVAKALEDVEFRDYIYRTSKKNTSEFFNEIVFAMHKDDKVISSKTLESVLRENVDKEVKGLLGIDFIDKILKDDPLITIKIPDIFYNLDWKTDEYSPLVLAKTPLELKDEDNFKSYIAYHYTGYQKIFSNHKLPEYFSIVVKYSEDYILYDKITYTNEKNIHIFDIIPQVESKWSVMEDEISKSGKPFILDNNKLFVKKLDVFNVFADKCEPNSYKFGDFLGCHEPCKRDCLIKDNIDNVLKEIKVNNLMIDRDTKGSILFEENYYLLYFISISDGFNIQIIDKYTLAGFRKIEYFDRNLDISYKQEKKDYENVGNVQLLSIDKINYNSSRFKSKTIELNHLIEKGWIGGDRYDLMILNYKQEDLVNGFNYIDKSILPQPVYATELLALGLIPISYCSDPNTNYHLGNSVDFVVEY